MSTVAVNDSDTLRSPRQQRQRRTLLVFGVPLLLVGGVLALWLIKVDRYIEARGFIVSRDHVTLRAPARASVSEVAVESGALVKAGDVLVRLSAPEAELALKEAAAAALAAKAQLALAEAKGADAAAGSAAALELEAARQTLAWREAQAERAALGAKSGVLTAPRDGLVLLYTSTPGDSVEAGQLLAEVVDPDHLVMQLRVAERYGNLMATGQACTARLAANIGSERQDLAGSVLAVEAVVRPGERGGYREFTADIDGGVDGGLRIGGAVAARVKVGRTSLLASIFGIY